MRGAYRVHSVYNHETREYDGVKQSDEERGKYVLIALLRIDWLVIHLLST